METNTSTVFVTGIPVVIHWKWHGPNQIEWQLCPAQTDPEQAMKLLENFLRTMRNDYINYILNEEQQARAYEADARAAAAAEDIPF